jgi:hypothetical protein
MRQGVAQCSAASPQWLARLAVAIQQQPAALLAVQAAVAVHRAVSAIRDGLDRAFPQLQHVSKEVRAWRARPPIRANARTLRRPAMARGRCSYGGGLERPHSQRGGPTGPPPKHMRRARATHARGRAHAHARARARAYTTQDLRRQLSRGARMMALLALPLARASSESLTAVYARTFEKAAFGFAKVGAGWDAPGPPARRQRPLATASGRPSARSRRRRRRARCRRTVHDPSLTPS